MGNNQFISLEKLNKKISIFGELKVFETFSGIGAQRKALDILNIKHQVVATSEWYINAIIAYNKIHNYNNKVNNKLPNIDEIKSYLNNFTFSNDSKKPIKDINKLNIVKLKELYLANKNINNLGDIKKISANDIPEFNFLTYSFPCQDLSVAGKGRGMDKHTKSRSSLVWEIIRILKELNLKNNLPKILLLENVKNIINKKHIQSFIKFKDELSNLGYFHKEYILNAKDFNLPQNRERFFMISTLDKIDFSEPKKVKLTTKLKDYIDTENLLKTSRGGVFRKYSPSSKNKKY